MSGDITQNMILLFMIIPNEHFHASLSESFLRLCMGQREVLAVYDSFCPVIGLTPHQKIPWFKLFSLALDGFVFSGLKFCSACMLVKAHKRQRKRLKTLRQQPSFSDEHLDRVIRPPG